MTSDERWICKRLITMGQRLFAAPPEPIEFTQVPAANDLLNDLGRYPHAFVLACIMDRQIKSEKAWLIPFEIRRRLGGSFSLKEISALKPNAVRRLMSKPTPLHRFVDTMSNCLHKGAQRIATTYRGDAARIWSDSPSSATVVYRFLEFDGVGPKIATMAANILARQFKIPFADYYSIDISVDVHVLRVFSRLGLTPTGASPNQVVYRTRAIHPDFPGLIDSPIWRIGRSVCRPKSPNCSACCLNVRCPTAKSRC